jgi:hypothetical protein
MIQVYSVPLSLEDFAKFGVTTHNALSIECTTVIWELRNLE